MTENNEENNKNFDENKENNYKNITFLEYFYKKYIEKSITRSIAYTLYPDIDLKEEQKSQNKILTRNEFINSLSFSDWYDTYGFYTVRNIKINSINIYLYLFLLIFCYYSQHQFPVYYTKNIVFKMPY